jgi:cysteine desulfurase
MIYLDHASTTSVDPKVVKKMTPYFSDKFGNPSGMYQVSNEAKNAIDWAREAVAGFLGANSSEIIFSSGGTESDNMAILGLARHFGKGHIITSKIEHSAVLNSCRQLEKEGFNVTYLNVDVEGTVKLDELKKAIRKDTILVSIMYANNEIGTIEPVKKISKIITDFRAKNKSISPYFHTDACQATLYLEMDVKRLGVDLLTFNGSKIYAPKGVGVLYIREGVPVDPILFGGEQERGLRPGTENVPYIVAIAEALNVIKRHNFKNEVKMRDFLINELLKIEHTHLNGSRLNRLPNNVNITFTGIEGEAAVLYLDKKGIAVSTGSACMSQSLKPSHVILALGKSEEAAHSSLRITLGRDNSIAQMKQVIKDLRQIVKKLREMSAIYE